ncbi:D-alanyl-D-alanine carboxypeptidase [Flagellimonas algicola]|uniref:D-alanyl-D-alanine carboxypeptidase n=1 Tax=Flagellimonas algicola TaxID=2583815 RepID=A0ABY2WPU4_9FLAO|nr:D-alanyl-D-alanine carboxypeptidase [Allomuricauda algicola]TMU57003.1 D-alanyl-D-alanine carboxypeptidase [Allomuricauda algicola]
MYHSYNQGVKYLAITRFVVFFLLASCSSSRFASFESKLESAPLNRSFHSLVVFNIDKQKEIYNHNGGRYFTPASNTKIVTLYTGTKFLPQQVPALKYISQNDTIYFEGTGDPSLLHPYFKDSTAIRFIQKYNTVFWHPYNSSEDRYGPGWAWEDFDTYFSPEKSALPLYGNVVTLFNVPELKASPELFSDSVQVKEAKFRREEFQNQFYLNPKIKDTIEVPFVTDMAISQRLLRDVLGKEIAVVDEFPQGPKETFHGIPMDSIYKRMMHKSDNFLAEQILMLASSTLSDTLSTKTAINTMLDKHLSDLPQQPRWVDGSGLSRYNLFTPNSLVHILKKLHNEISQERLFQLFPMWDATGTVDTWNHPGFQPFIFAKSGSFGNHYNLSGYLITRSGKVFIFSFMNNHFRVPSHEIRTYIFATLKSIHERY